MNPLQFSLQPTLDHSMEGSSLKRPSTLFMPLTAYTGSPRWTYWEMDSFRFMYIQIHWVVSLQVPPTLYDDQGKSINKGCVNICSSSPEAVSNAYYSQFKEDFSIFLQFRSKEVVTGGRMVLIVLGREGTDHVDRGNSFFWELLARSLADLVAQVYILYRNILE